MHGSLHQPCHYLSSTRGFKHDVLSVQTSMLWRQHSCIFLFFLIPHGLEVMCLLQKARFTVSFLIRREVVCLIDNFTLPQQQCRKWPMGFNQRPTPFLLFATLTSLHTADTELSISFRCGVCSCSAERRKLIQNLSCLLDHQNTCTRIGFV